MLTAGTRLGAYEVLAAIGAGGMGEVYRALDTKLGRHVAIKLLPDAFAQDPERAARFDREARVLASLNHANIAALFGLEQSDGRVFLAMELVEGDTLADRIARGPVPIAEALSIGHQICEALEAAHAKGIVHRDLKPANVKITPEGKVKVLDFGLAKAFAPEGAGASADAPTLTSPMMMTHQGMILGTAAYMSPEQAKGREVDQRADIFAFGCVLFELLTDRRSFPGDTVTESIASILAREADFTLLPANIHPRIPELLRRCLEKDSSRRWQAIGDVRVEIDAILPDPHGLKVAAIHTRPLPWWKWAAVIAATAVVAAAATLTIARALQPSLATPSPVRFSFTLPKDQSFTRTGRHVLAISPDGTSVVYVANNQLYLKSMSDMEAKPIAGTNQDVNTPFFSPDGRWIAFAAVPENKLKKIAVTGGASVTLADVDNPYGADWYADAAMLVGQGPKGIVRVSANGGKPETVVTVKPDEVAQSPHMLPDGQTVLFTLEKGSNLDWDKAQIVAQSLKSGQRTVLVDGGSDARYVPTGHIVYAVGGAVYAVPFDARALKVTGGPVPVVDGVARASCCTAASLFAVSWNGSFVAVPGSAGAGVSPRVLALVQRSGEKKLLDVPPGGYSALRFSPDGKQVALQIWDGKEFNIWLYDVAARSALRRLTFGGTFNNFPVWTPDGKRILFASDRDNGTGALWWQAADGSGQAERLTPTLQGGVEAESWSPDGRVLSYWASNVIWTLRLGGDRKPTPLIQTAKGSAFASRFSPDGHWMAYTSDESSTKDEVFVQPYPPTGAKYLISPTRGGEPTWSPDGRQLFYRSQSVATAGLGTSRMMAVDIRTQPSFSFSAPVPLPIEGFTNDGYDISPDGKQFLMTFPPSETKTGDKTPLQINVVLNWFTELTNVVRR